MNQHSPDEIAKQDFKQPTVSTYIIGFVFSLVLTLAAFTLVWRYTEKGDDLFSKSFLFAWVAVLAISQLLAQLVFFLHLGRESKPRWNFTVLAFAAVVVVTLVFGSLWIMWNLRYHEGHGSNSGQTETEIIHDEGFHP